jgi:hypothetical protein
MSDDELEAKVRRFVIETLREMGQEPVPATVGYVTGGILHNLRAVRQGPAWATFDLKAYEAELARAALRAVGDTEREGAPGEPR